jgi:hypothetical protein
MMQGKDVLDPRSCADRLGMGGAAHFRLSFCTKMGIGTVMAVGSTDSVTGVFRGRRALHSVWRLKQQRNDGTLLLSLHTIDFFRPIRSHKGVDREWKAFIPAVRGAHVRQTLPDSVFSPHLHRAAASPCCRVSLDSAFSPRLNKPVVRLVVIKHTRGLLPQSSDSHRLVRHSSSHATYIVTTQQMTGT